MYSHSYITIPLGCGHSSCREGKEVALALCLQKTNFKQRFVTCDTLLVLPLLLVSFILLNDTSCLIQWAPVLGESGCMYVLFPVHEENVGVHIQIHNILVTN